jgi:hypothetical protein
LFYNNFVYFGLIYFVNTHQTEELSKVPVMDVPIVSRSGKSVVLAAQKLVRQLLNLKLWCW